MKDKDKERIINKMKKERENGIISYNKLGRNKGNLKRSLKKFLNFYNIFSYIIL